jgi:hypothetical protein
MATFEQGHALIVGVGGNLPNTVQDAKGLAEILKDGERCGYPAGQVHLLTGEGATRGDVLQALDDLAQSTGDQSTVVVYFSGHGYRVASTMGQAYYLLPFGYDVSRLYQTAVSGGEFAQRLHAIPAQKLVVLLDCCHAGGVGEAKGLDLAKSPLPPEATSLLAEGSGRVIIASSKEDELSYAGNPYSAFTLALIEALAGTGVAKEDGYVRVTDLALHAREVVPGRTQGRQHPILHFEEADNFVLAYYAGGDTQPKGLPFDVEPQIEPEPGAWTVVQGPVLSGTFDGPVAIGGGEAVDMRGAQGAIYKPSGPVEQHFGDRYDSGVTIGDVSGGIHDTVIAGRDVTNATITGGSQQRSADQGPSIDQLRQLVGEIQRELARVVAQQDALRRVSPAAPFTAQGAEQAIKDIAARVNEPPRPEDAESMQASLEEASGLLSGILEGARAAAQKAGEVGEAVLPIAEKLAPIVEKLGVLAKWVAKLWASRGL